MTIQVEHRGGDYARVRIYGNGEEVELEVSLNMADAIDSFNDKLDKDRHELSMAVLA